MAQPVWSEPMTEPGTKLAAQAGMPLPTAQQCRGYR